MILVDTNVLIDFFNSPDQAVFEVIMKKEVATCGVVQVELLHGAKSDKQIKTICKMLDSLKYIPMETSDWQKIGLFLRLLKKHGLSVPLADSIIAYLAIKNNCEVWTQDRHFILIKEVVNDLQLFGGCYF